MKYLNSLILLMLLLFISTDTRAQEEMDILQALFGMEKRAMAKEVLTVPAADTDAFWLLYEEYESARKMLGKERVGLLAEYAENYDNLDEKGMNSLVSEAMALTDSNEKLIRKYYKKIEKQFGGLPAGQFYQFESYIHSAIREEIFGNIPVITQLKQ